MPTEKVTESSGNVFLDLGFPEKEAAELRMRADLMARLRLLIEGRKWTEAEAADKLAVSPSCVSDLMRGAFDQFGIDMLLKFAARAGLRVGEGEIEQTFFVTGRGKVLVLRNGWTGIIPENGLIACERGTWPYVGPDHVDEVGDLRNRACVRIDAPEAQDDVEAGEPVTFFVAKHP
jgi:predicted XRE-type DNA-binding protein